MSIYSLTKHKQIVSIILTHQTESAIPIQTNREKNQISKEMNTIKQNNQEEEIIK
jgi:hypothetical protein